MTVAREGVILLKNKGNILPVAKQKSRYIRIVATGKYLTEIAQGGGAATVQGYNNITLADALHEQFGDRIEMVNMTDDSKISSADLVLLSIGTFDSEGCDRSFDLPDEDLQIIDHVLHLNKNSVVIVNSGSGINMSPWIENAAAVLYAWYGGQTGCKAIAEILSGAVNPSGKLPISIEKRFEDSPGYGYLPEGEKLYSGWLEDEYGHKLYDVEYKEGIFVGYRWYEQQNIKPLFAFGHGLSYSTFEYGNLHISSKQFSKNDKVEVTFTVKNTSKVDGSEITQLYIQDVKISHPRPVKELKGFKKVFLKAGEEEKIKIILQIEDFSYWNPDLKRWYAEPGEFNILVGSASDNILLKQTVVLQ